MVRAPAGRWFVLRARVLALKSCTIYNFIVIIITIILYRSRSVCASAFTQCTLTKFTFFVSLPSPRSVLPYCSGSIAHLWRKYDAVGRSVRPTIVVNPSENPNFHPIFGDVERVCRNSILLQYCFPSAERPLTRALIDRASVMPPLNCGIRPGVTAVTVTVVRRARTTVAAAAAD